MIYTRFRQQVDGIVLGSLLAASQTFFIFVEKGSGTLERGFRILPAMVWNAAKSEGLDTLENLVPFLETLGESSRNLRNSGKMSQNPENPHNPDSIESSKILKDPLEFSGNLQNPMQSL